MDLESRSSAKSGFELLTSFYLAEFKNFVKRKKITLEQNKKCFQNRSRNKNNGILLSVKKLVTKLVS